MKVVLDCNILVICLTSRSPFHKIYQAIVSGGLHLAVTTEIIFEYREIIQQKYGSNTANAFIALLNELPNVHLITTYYHWQLISTDPDDNKYCDCSIAAQAEYLVTEDKHFKVLLAMPFPQIKIISLDAFSTLLDDTMKK